MPTPALKSFAARANVSLTTAEMKWDEAKKEVDQGLKTKDSKQYWARVMWLTQKKLGLKEERLTFLEYAEVDLLATQGETDLPPAPVEPTVNINVEPEPNPDEQQRTQLTAELSCFVACLFGARDFAHRLHLQTTSFAQHAALEELYKLLVLHADRFAEVGMGITGFPLNIVLPSEAAGWSLYDAVSFIRSLTGDLPVTHGPCFKPHPVLENMFQELMADLFSIKYKLEQLH